jgi:hypothetical protein
LSRAKYLARFHLVLWAKSVANVYRRVLLVALVMTSAGCAASTALPDGSPGDVGTRPRGGVTVVHGIAIGTTSSGGPNCYDAYANSATYYDDGCGTLYGADARGGVHVLRAFSDPAVKHSAGRLIDGGDGWLYGKADPSTYANGGPIVFRVTADGRKYEIVHRFLLADGIADLSQLSLGPDRKLYATASLAPTTMRTGIVLLRIDGAKYAMLATFNDDMFALTSPIAPIVSKDGIITGVLTDRSLCVSLLFRREPSGVVRRLYERDPKSEAGCSSGDEPGPSLAADGDAVVSLNAHAVMRISKDGKRRIIGRLPAALGTFVGPPVLVGPDLFALTTSASGEACSRLVRIDAERTRVVHAFMRAEGRCLDAVALNSHLTRDGSAFFVTTSEGAHCAEDIPEPRLTPADTSCGALVRVRADGTVAYAHDFVARKRVSDGGSPLTRTMDSVRGRMLTIVFVRAPHGPAPFVLDSGKIVLMLRSTRGNATRVRASSDSIVSHRESHDVLSAQDTDVDVANADFMLPSVLPADLYAFSFDATDAIHDSLGEPIATESRSFTDNLYLPAAGNGDLETMRKRFVGRDVFGIQGVTGTCPDGNTLKSFAATDALRVASVTRLAADTDPVSGNYESNGEVVGRDFFRVEPLEVVLATGKARPTGSTPSGSDDAPCPQIRFLVADSWELDRQVSLRPPVDPTWPRVDLDAIRNGKPIVGMTRAMVVAIWGYPSAYGTIDEIDRLNHWNYQQAGPFGHSVDFRGGRVVSVRLPRDLP